MTPCVGCHGEQDGIIQCLRESWLYWTSLLLMFCLGSPPGPSGGAKQIHTVTAPTLGYTRGNAGHQRRFAGLSSFNSWLDHHRAPSNRPLLEAQTQGPWIWYKLIGHVVHDSISSLSWCETKAILLNQPCNYAHHQVLSEDTAEARMSSCYHESN